MIQIHKPAAPDKLLADGQAETKRNCRLYDEGQREFEFNSAIYAHATVKAALHHAQHGKCCFCERKEEIGDVEHFRPKSGYQQDAEERLQKPGYYWLAYAWDNLFFCCPTCNRSYKRNFFPLADAGKRAQSHHDDVAAEDALLIHPQQDNPEDFIEFYGERPRAIQGNAKGKVTIERTGLDRPFINEDRFKHYKNCKALYETLKLSASLPESLCNDLRRQLENAVKDDAEYASMIRCAIRHQFRF